MRGGGRCGEEGGAEKAEAEAEEAEAEAVRWQRWGQSNGISLTCGPMTASSSFPLPLPPHPPPLPVPPVHHPAALKSDRRTAGGCQDIGCAHHCLDMPAHPQQPPAVSQPEVELQWSIMVLRGKRRCFKHEIGGACQKNGENAEDDGGWGRKETLRNSLGMCALAGAYRRLFSALWTCRLS
ncbi:hypothetical protein BXZ70DRAFT_958018 [Cristinia sonorae]|uniref:Uncharacterized protein n=1 Tax=Cristinia sonorae TaxID=1940300 RepID=A0A8K0XL73_9AGAR|nr:hypothetical protein BXZ70DRAFT_958018 [Cristinia sonorae]